MATRRGSLALPIRSHVVVIFLTAVAVALGLVAAVQAPSHADPGLTIAQAQREVNALYNQASRAQEAYNTAHYKVQQTQANLARVRKQLDEQKRTVAKAEAQLSTYATAMYATGGMDPTLQLMLSDNPTEFLAQAGALDQMAQDQSAAVRDANAAKLQMAQTQQVVNDQLASLKKLQAQAAKQKQAVDSKLAAARNVLSHLKAQQRARLARLQRQRAAAAAAQAQQQLATVPAPTVASTPTSSGNGGGGGGGVAVNGRAAAAVAYARAQVGKPYVFGAAGPSAFDCSGLTMMAWAQAGVSLAHSATVQYYQTTRISQSSIQPGDLVFFYSGPEHVGIYIGGGLFVHAANPSEGVRVDSLFSSYWQSVLLGIGRV